MRDLIVKCACIHICACVYVHVHVCMSICACKHAEVLDSTARHVEIEHRCMRGMYKPECVRQ